MRWQRRIVVIGRWRMPAQLGDVSAALLGECLTFVHQRHFCLAELAVPGDLRLRECFHVVPFRWLIRLSASGGAFPASVQDFDLLWAWSSPVFELTAQGIQKLSLPIRQAFAASLAVFDQRDVFVGPRAHASLPATCATAGTAAKVMRR